jgi:hypothetical protein
MFNAYFAGIQCREAEDYIEKQKLLRLLSYHNDKKRFEERSEKGLVTFLDSGAFTAWTKDAKIDVEEYIQYTDKWDKGLSYFMQIDDIPGTRDVAPTMDQILEANKNTWENFIYMFSKVKSPEKLVPVYHFGSNPANLDRILNFEPKVDLLALGALVGQPKAQREAFLTTVFEQVKKSNNPDIKIHALGVHDFRILEKFPLYSADATSWIMVGATGNIMTKYGNILVSVESTEKKNHFENQKPAVQEELLKMMVERGFTYKGLSTTYQDRMVWNLMDIEQRCINYEYKPQPKQRSLFGGM